MLFVMVFILASLFSNSTPPAELITSIKGLNFVTVWLLLFKKKGKKKRAEMGDMTLNKMTISASGV